MSNIARNKALRVLASAIATFPRLRICQLIVNATNVPNSDPYYVTDEALAEALEKYVAVHGRKV